MIAPYRGNRQKSNAQEGRKLIRYRRRRRDGSESAKSHARLAGLHNPAVRC
jgi:hypothetical protein